MNTQKNISPRRPSLASRIRMALVCLIVLGGGIAGAAYLKETAPKARKKPPVKTIPLVAVMPAFPGSQTIRVPATGTVLPAREVQLKSRVTGEVTALHTRFTTGGMVKAGDELIRLDPEDYRLAIVQKQGEVADADYALQLELGYQDVAKKEWEALNGSKPSNPEDSALALRKPHLAKARADLNAVRADLDQARVNLARTKLSAPFDAFVREKFVEPGSQVTPQDILAELVGTEEYWIQAALPVDALQWITIPAAPDQEGSHVWISYRNTAKRQGRVIKLLGDLAPSGRMARLLISVKDPLVPEPGAPDQPPLLIGEYVRMEIEGRRLDNAYSLPATALKNGREIWIADRDNTLEIRPVTPLWRDRDRVILSQGLAPGEQLILSDLAIPVAGMPLRIEKKQQQSTQGADK